MLYDFYWISNYWMVHEKDYYNDNGFQDMKPIYIRTFYCIGKIIRIVRRGSESEESSRIEFASTGYSAEHSDNIKILKAFHK